jgi:hypothetical protein
MVHMSKRVVSVNSHTQIMSHKCLLQLRAVCQVPQTSKKKKERERAITQYSSSLLPSELKLFVYIQKSTTARSQHPLLRGLGCCLLTALLSQL